MRNSKKKNHNPLTSLPNFNPLLSVLRTELGLNWGIYNEFLDEVQAAIAAGKNISTWTNQMEPLIKNEACRVAHQGVLFLLRDMHSRQVAKDKAVATSYPSSLSADKTSLPKSETDTEAVIPSDQPLAAHSTNKNIPSVHLDSENFSAPSATIVSEQQAHASPGYQQQQLTPPDYYPEYSALDIFSTVPTATPNTAMHISFQGVESALINNNTADEDIVVWNEQK